jgi:hypothetical protein
MLFPDAWFSEKLRGASKIKLKNANKKRTVIVRKVFLNNYFRPFSNLG